MVKITIIHSANRFPNWLQQGLNEFIKRLQEFVQLDIITVGLFKRSPTHLNVLLAKESEKVLKVIPRDAKIIALTVDGKRFDSLNLAKRLESLQQQVKHLCFIIGGPEGLSAQVLAVVSETWSLSLLTFPHGIAQLLLLETLYRSFTILTNHPYHKA